jgi:hypothetical protein
MNSKDIKNELHNLIDSIDNELLLMKFYDLMLKSTTNKEGELWNSLTQDQKNQLLLADMEANEPENLISYNQQKTKHKKWHQKSNGPDVLM